MHGATLLWEAFLGAAGTCVAFTGPKYLHLIDRKFPELLRSDPAAAAKQVKTFRILGAVMALFGIVLIVFNLSGTW